MKVRWLVLPAVLLIVIGCGTPTEGSTAPANGAAEAGQSAGAATPSASGENTQPAPPAGDATAAAAGGATSGRKQYSEAPAMRIDQNKQYTATITTSKGVMKAELFAKDAPITVNNFVFLARDGFYNGIKFHRIIKGFMVQTGDPNGNGSGGPGYSFKDEPVKRDYVRGTLAMANAGPNTNGSQFFIVHQDNPLPKSYTIFGKVTDGLDVLDAIANTPTVANPNERGAKSLPQEDVRITSVTIEEK